MFLGHRKIISNWNFRVHKWSCIGKRSFGDLVHPQLLHMITAEPSGFDGNHVTRKAETVYYVFPYRKRLLALLQAAIELTFKQLCVVFTPKPLKTSTSFLKGVKLCQSDSLVLSQISRVCDLNSFPMTLYQVLCILDHLVSRRPHEGMNWHEMPSAG